MIYGDLNTIDMNEKVIQVATPRHAAEISDPRGGASLLFLLDAEEESNILWIENLPAKRNRVKENILAKHF